MSFPKPAAFAVVFLVVDLLAGSVLVWCAVRLREYALQVMANLKSKQQTHRQRVNDSGSSVAVKCVQQMSSPMVQMRLIISLAAISLVVLLCFVGEDVSAILFYCKPSRNNNQHLRERWRIRIEFIVFRVGSSVLVVISYSPLLIVYFHRVQSTFQGSTTYSLSEKFGLRFYAWW